MSGQTALKPEVRDDDGTAKRHLLNHRTATLLEGQKSITDRYANPIGLVAKTAERLPRQIRTARTDVEIIRYKEFAATKPVGTAEVQTAPRATNAIPDAPAGRQAARAAKSNASVRTRYVERQAEIRGLAYREESNTRNQIDVAPGAIGHGVAACKRPYGALDPGARAGGQRSVNRDARDTRVE